MNKTKRKGKISTKYRPQPIYALLPKDAPYKEKHKGKFRNALLVRQKRGIYHAKRKRQIQMRANFSWLFVVAMPKALFKQR